MSGNPLSTEHDDSLLKALVEHSRAPTPFEYSENPPLNSNSNESTSTDETLEEHSDLFEAPPNKDDEANDEETNGEPSKHSPPPKKT